jgi:hypothetical protein
LASQGYDLETLIDGYPATVVKGLLAASRILRRRQLTEGTMSMVVAVTGALDLAFNQGKGKVLERWMREMEQEEEASRQAKRPKISERAFSFFTSLPRRHARG